MVNCLTSAFCTATATIITDTNPVANADSYRTTPGSTLTTTAGTGVLANDTDADGDTLTASVVTGPTHASAFTLNPNGSFSYTPTVGFHGSDSFTYQVSDGLGGTSTATATIITDTNPVANADSYRTTPGSTLTTTAGTGVLANDTDADGDTLTASVVTGPTHASAFTLNPNGSFSYTPTVGFHGSDSFTYQVSDGLGGTSTATATIITDTNPVANADSYRTTPGSTLTTTAGTGVLANDTDADGDTLTASVVTGPTHASAFTLNTNGSFSYTPTVGFHGSDSFTYQVSDGLGGTSTATATIITDTNPVANADSYTMVQGGTLTTTTLTGVLHNDTDADGDTLSASVLTGPAHASAFTLNPDGTFTYTPTAGFHGTDTFTYQANDGLGGTSTATATIKVDAPPVANADNYVTGPGATLVVPAASGVISNDTDADGDPLTISNVTSPSHGALSMNADGSFSYTPTAGFHGTDSFTYTVTDGFAQSNTATVNIAVDTAPVANGDSYAVGMNTPLTVAAGSGVQANDTDADGDALTSSVVAGPTHGGLTLNSDGSFTYTPNAGYTGADSFTYKDNDGTQDSNTVAVTLNVGGGGDYFGTPGNDTHTAGVGETDHVSATTQPGGTDNLTGNTGATLSFDTATGGVTATAGSGTVSYTTASGPGTTTYTGFENLTGSAFNDTLIGDANGNVLNGGAGDDVLVAGLGGGTLNGGSGNDTADFSQGNGVTVSLANPGAQTVGGGFTAPVTLTGIENLTGSSGNDILQGNSGDNLIDGNGGTDTVDYSNTTANGLVVNLMTGTASGGGAGNDTLFNIANVTGSNFSQTLIGDDNNNNLTANGSDGGLDVFYGHGGSNVMTETGSNTSVAYYTGLAGDYSFFDNGLQITSVSGGADNVNDILMGVDRVKFLSPTQVSDVDNVGLSKGVGDQISQFHDSVNNQTDISINGSPALPVVDTGNNTVTLSLTTSVVGTGLFNPDTLYAAADILTQDSSSGALSVLVDQAGTLVQNNVQGAVNGTNLNANWKVIATGDFNGDASADILLQNQSTKALEIFTLNSQANQPIGTVDSVNTVTGPAGTAWKAIATGDFNGDGKSDILFQNTSSKAIEIYEMNQPTGGHWTAVNAPFAQAASGLTAVATGDFNGDGKSDILFTNASGQAVIWLMNGDSHIGTKTVAKPGAGYTVSGAQDTDGNGYSDIVWTNGTTNVATVFVPPPSLTTAMVGTPATAMLNSTPSGFTMVASTGGG
jgi:VCBS repeat-containing protein